MKKILCPTDFSDTALGATIYAAKLAQATNSELTLFNVQSLFDLTPIEIVQGKAETMAGVGHRLEAQCEEIRRTFHISCRPEVESSVSKLSAVIHDRASDFDLIVMGSNGPDDWYQYMGGSNTYNAIVKSDVPVLMIPQGFEYSAITEVVYAFDYFHEENLPIARLISFVKLFNCELTILQVMKEPYSRAGDEQLEKWQTRIKEWYGDSVKLRFETIYSTEIPQTIDSYVTERRPDVLALCSIHRNFVERLFHKSVIKHLAAVTIFPTYVFHE
ncbi:MAG: universal stress protein [Bacteroidota bacterium]